MEHKTFATIVNEKNIIGESITYSDELEASEWKEKRLIILNRDNNICTNCKTEPTIKEFGRPHRNQTPEEKQKYLKEYQMNFDNYFNEYIKGLPELSRPLKPEIGKEIVLPRVLVDKHIILHVHHKYYINHKLAWEYSNDVLITLCQNCHQDLHNKTKIKVYADENMDEQLDLTECPKCKGSGYLNEYDYYKNGICFSCNGYKYLELIK